MLTVLLLDDDPISATHTADDLAAEGLKVIKASPFSAWVRLRLRSVLTLQS